MYKVAFVNLGCPKNLVDAEIMAGALVKTGAVDLVDDMDVADVIVVNTCGFIDIAKEESVDEILNAVWLKRIDPCKRVIVSGCLYQRYMKDLVREFPEVDGFVLPGDVNEMIYLVTGKKAKCNIHRERYLMTPSHLAYLKISEGCSNKCSYCAIPLIKGALKSRRIEDVVEEAVLLADRGVREVYVISQDTTSYMNDCGMENGILKLLEHLEKIDQIRWIRLMYMYPSRVSDSLIDFITDSEKILNYFDIPLQHVSDRVLSLMGRDYTGSYARELVFKLKKKIPDVTIRTGFIVGFPGEDEDEFRELCDFVREAEFDWVGLFRYSREEGTKAYAFGDVDRGLKDYRFEILEGIQSEVYRKKAENLIGSTFKVLIDGESCEIDGYVEGRSYRSAYDVDGVVYLKGSYRPGSFVNVVIKEPATDVDFFAEPVLVACGE